MLWWGNQKPADPQNELGKRLLGAAKKGDDSETGSLLLAKADIHYKDATKQEVKIEGLSYAMNVLGCTALHWAAIYNRVDIITLLLHQKADIHRTDDSGGSTALHWACVLGNTESVAILIHNGAHIEYLSEQKNTPLHMACKGGKVQVVATLLNHNADLNPKDKDGDTPLHRASYQGESAVVGLLLAAKADPTVKNASGQIPGGGEWFFNRTTVPQTIENFKSNPTSFKTQLEEEKKKAAVITGNTIQRAKVFLDQESENLQKLLESEGNLAQSQAARQREQKEFKKQLSAVKTERDGLLKRLEAAERERDQMKAEKEEATVRAEKATAFVQRLQSVLDEVKNELHRTTTSLNERDRDVLVAVLDRSKNAAQGIVSRNDQASLTQAQSAVDLYRRLISEVPKSVFVAPDIPTIPSSELQIKESLGSGVGGTVVRAERTVPQGKPQGPPMAWKMPHTTTREQGQIEADLWRKCPPHPNLITLRAMVHKDGAFAGVLMDLCSQSLDGVKLGVVELKQCAQETTRGLAHLHACRILHRDLAPRNILVQRIGKSTRYAITDFGLSRTLNVNYQYERVGSGVALPWRTLAPEIHRARIQLLGGKEGDEQGKVVFGKPSDVWALGVTLWELATNQHAYANEKGQPQEIQERIGNGSIKLDVEPLILTHRELAPAIIGCLQHDPKSRPTASQLLLLLNDDSMLAAKLYGDFINDIKRNAP